MQIAITQSEANQIGKELEVVISLWEKGGHRRAYVKSNGIQIGWIDLNTSEVHTSGDRWNEMPGVLAAMTAQPDEAQTENEASEVVRIIQEGQSEIYVMSNGARLVMD